MKNGNHRREKVLIGQAEEEVQEGGVRMVGTVDEVRTLYHRKKERRGAENAEMLW